MSFREPASQLIRRVRTGASPPVPPLRRILTKHTPSIQVGDPVPHARLMESSPGNRVSLADELGPGQKGVIIGIPAAFSPSCSATHIPGYIKSPALAAAGKVFVVSVNDAFVMKAFKASLDPENTSGIRFLADPHGDFTQAVDMIYSYAKAVFGQSRSRRYALVVEDGRISQIFVEPDSTGVKVSTAENVLKL